MIEFEQLVDSFSRRGVKIWLARKLAAEKLGLIEIVDDESVRVNGIEHTVRTYGKGEDVSDEAEPKVWQDAIEAFLGDQQSAMLGNGDVYVFRSQSDPRGFYYVFQVAGVTVCDCKSFRYRGKCRHVDGLTDALGGV